MNTTTQEIRWKVAGLCCGDCARRIEEEVRSLPEVAQATVNFATGTLAATPQRAIDEEKFRKACQSAVQRIEADHYLVPVKGDQKTDEGMQFFGFTMSQLCLAAAIVIFALAFALHRPWPLVLHGAAWILAGGPVLRGFIVRLRLGDFFNEHSLMSIAGLGAWALSEGAEAAAVMIFYRVGEALQELAVERARRDIAALMDLNVPEAIVVAPDGSTSTINPESLKVGDVVALPAGGRAPTDGVVVTGRSSLDLSALTGESLPRSVETGDEIHGGAINREAPLEVRVTALYADSTVARILALVEEASSRKARTERFITRMARWYTPLVFCGAILTGLMPPLLLLGSWSEWFYRALVFLVVSCPCALVVSVPLTFFAGIGSASRRGVLIKGGNYLEVLSKTGAIAFDKTGTLSCGRLSVERLVPAPGISPEELLRIAASLESTSTHPVARSVTEHWNQHHGTETLLNLEDRQEEPGRGVMARQNGMLLLAGNAALLAQHGVTLPDEAPRGAIHLARDGAWAGSIVFVDGFKDDSPEAMKKLRHIGVSFLALVSGDSPESVEPVASALEMNQWRGGLLPHEKVQALSEFRLSVPKGKSLLFVGDGINDAPVLAAADAGIAMGGLGSAAAIEAADVVLMTDEPSRLADGVAIAHVTMKVARQNVALALGFKALVMVLDLAGYANLWLAVFADVGVTLIAVANALRVLRFDPSKR